jgi:hypothetical protein
MTNCLFLPSELHFNKSIKHCYLNTWNTSGIFLDIPESLSFSHNAVYIHFCVIRVRARIMGLFVNLYLDETILCGENQQPFTSHQQPLSHTFVSSTPCHDWDSKS